MYLNFFHFTDEPFKITPDPKFFFLSRQHEEVLEALLYGINQRKGFMALIGDIGTGKTTVCRALLNRLDKSIDTSVILNPMLSVQELLEAINDDFGNRSVVKDTVKGQMDALYDFMIRRLRFRKNAVVIIDEAQHLSVEAMEMLRMLSNLEREDKKLMQIVFLGQRELESKLISPELRQLNQRIGIRYFLGPLSHKETYEYIIHRLNLAGGAGFVQFEEKALARIYRYSQGVPRVINILCDRALLETFASKGRLVTAMIVEHAHDDIEGRLNPSAMSMIGGRKKAWEFWKWFN